MTLRYEDTVTPEIAPCEECGALTGEDHISQRRFRTTEQWICEDCDAPDHTGEDG